MSMNTLRYEKPARHWEEALPLGNGRMGAMVYGRVDKERIELNEDTLWAGRPAETEEGYSIRENIDAVRQLIREGNYAEATKLTDKMTGPHTVQPYLLAGNLYLEFGDAVGVDAYERTLDLATATSTATFRRNGATFVRESLVSAPHQVMAMRLTADEAGAIDFALSADSLMRTTVPRNTSAPLISPRPPARQHTEGKAPHLCANA